MAVKSLRDLLVGPGPISQFERFGHRQEAPVRGGLSPQGFAPSPPNVFGNGATGMAPQAVTASGAPLGTFNFGNPFANEGGRDTDDGDDSGESADDSGVEDEAGEEGGEEGGEGGGEEGGEGDDDF